MSSSKSRISYALLFSLLVFVAAPQSASALSHSGPSAPRHAPRNQHAHYVEAKKRMVKLQQRQGIANALDPNKDTTDDTTNTSNSNANSNANANANNAAAQSSTAAAGASASTTPAAAAATSTTPAAAANAQTTTTPSGGNLLSALLGGNSQSSTTAAATSSTQSSASSASTPATSSTPPAATTPSSTPTLNLVEQSQTSSAAGRSTISLQQTVNILPTTSVAPQDSNSTANTIGRNTIIAIVVIASCVGGAAAIWTLIRKWKLGPSKQFDARMQPIEWNPEMGTGGDSGLPGALREKDGASSYGGEKHRRAGSNGSHGSFHSGEGEQNNLGRNVTGNGNMFADQNPSGYAPEAHDFTAGAANYNQYDANAGYVDLQRSNSGGHAAGADLARGPSVGHNGYGAQYGAYGAHDAYAPDAYGGYDAYGGQHQQEQYPQAQYGAGYQQGARY